MSKSGQTLCPSKKEVDSLLGYLWSDALEKGGVRRWNRWAVVSVAVHTGMRVSEIARLKIDHITFGSPHACIWIPNRKNGCSTTVPLSDFYIEKLRLYLNKKGISSGHVIQSERKKPFSRCGLQKLFKRIINERGLCAEYSIHSLRHYFCNWLFDSTHDIQHVQSCMGHKTNVTIDYLKRSYRS